MELWGQVGRSYKVDDKSKPSYYIDYQCLPVLFQIYGIDGELDKRFVLGMMSRIVGIHDSSPLSADQILGWADIPDE